MYLLSGICRIFVAFAICVCGTGVAFAEVTTVGSVDKVQAQVDATQAGHKRAMLVGADVYFKDICHSGPDARLQATLKDGTQLTLGANATVVVDEFVYSFWQPGGALSVRVTKGAFLFVGGRVEDKSGAKVDIHTPVGTIGVRGTTVWGGPIDNGYGVIVLSGQATLTTKTGTVVLGQNQGTMVFGQAKPQSARGWPANRLKRAVASISFASPPAAR
ncbi:MAG TPA: FecR family protein [Xanthobacteraceae bacterium]